MQFDNTHNTTIGMDIAKNTFHVARLSRSDRVTDSVQLKRQKMSGYFTGIEPCKLAMEACGGAHYWGRRLLGHGHDVLLLLAHKVKPYVQGEKYDRNDAVAIAEACRRPGFRTVAVKSMDQQDLALLVKLCAQAVRKRTQMRNALRSHRSEHGLVAAQGKAALYRLIESTVTIDDDGVLRTDDELTGMFLMTLSYEYQYLLELESQVAQYDRRLKDCADRSEVIQRLMELPGFGPVAAWLGLTPRQHTTGGKPRLLGISQTRQPRTALADDSRCQVGAGQGRQLGRPAQPLDGGVAA